MTLLGVYYLIWEAARVGIGVSMRLSTTQACHLTFVKTRPVGVMNARGGGYAV